MDYSNTLQQTIELLVNKDPNRGLLAADESIGTIKKRFDTIGVENTEENRQLYRELLLTTPSFEKYICGVIMFDETLGHSTRNGKKFLDLLLSMNINQQIQDKLNYLYTEREKIESTGFRIDPDVKKTYYFINKEIHN